LTENEFINMEIFHDDAMNDLAMAHLDNSWRHFMLHAKTIFTLGEILGFLGLEPSSAWGADDYLPEEAERKRQIRILRCIAKSIMWRVS